MTGDSLAPPAHSRAWGASQRCPPQGQGCAPHPAHTPRPPPRPAGEKGQLQREGKLARRAAREAARGYDLLQLSADMMGLVERDGDMAALPLAGLRKGKHGLLVARKLAGLYGLKSSVQVGGLGAGAERVRGREARRAARRRGRLGARERVRSAC